MKEKALKAFKIILIVVSFCIPIATIALNSFLVVGDELWNFQNVEKMVYGGKLYVDCNVIITPIFHLIGYVFVKLITGTIFGFRIYNIFIYLFLVMITFILFKALKINTIKSFIYTLLAFIFIEPYITVGANYNVLVEAFVILGITLFFNKDKIKYYNVIQGIVIFLCGFTKQNIGVYYVLALSIAEFLRTKKEAIRPIITQIIVALIFTIIAVIIMCISGCFEGFLNFAILGMSDFAGNNFKLQYYTVDIIVGYALLVLCSYFLIFIAPKENEEIVQNSKELAIFALFLNLTVFPIINVYHTSFAIYINAIMSIYLIDYILLSKISKRVLIITSCVVYCLIFTLGLVYIAQSAGESLEKEGEIFRIKDKNNAYYSAMITTKADQKIKDVCDYIKVKEKEGIDVICISSDSALYMINLHKNHKELDLCFNGNLGINGKQNTMDKLASLENIEILVSTDPFWQEPEEIRNFVRNNFELKGRIQDLMIYGIK